ncbi:hypothetical protein J5N97_020484 [Dioscorea zingiberensis]|uniref:Proliferating cell nuclear antigen PCNA C-terminal domain-containing protein n=1 Tax=Dioscorea zingiberensis TaxID=325984 RepID=A0A9D5HDP7_9LILI|nr:hypothetical protein J5N97_020484 [Dioscorea zingiberensis]
MGDRQLTSHLMGHGIVFVQSLPFKRLSQNVSMQEVITSSHLLYSGSFSDLRWFLLWIVLLLQVFPLDEVTKEDQDSISDIEMKLMHIKSEHLGILDAEYKAVIKMPSRVFLPICKDLSNIGDIVDG